ncbi:hypothetical protein QJQ45_024854, partial [Haematococcus lacustris]
VVLLACRKVLRRPSNHKQDAGRLLCKVVLVDEPRTSQVSSSANRPQPSKRSKRTQAEKAVEATQPTKGKGQAKDEAAKAKPHPDRSVIKVPEGAVLRGCKKTRRKLREHRTSRVSSAVNGQQPCEVELNTLSATRPAGWRPPAGQVEERLVRPAWSQERGQPVRGLVWCPVVAPRRPPQAPRSSQAATPAAASEPGPSTPQPAKRSKRTKAEPGAAEPTKGKGKGKAAKAKPAPQPGRWLDRDCNAALNMQRIGESRWRPLELCFWPDQGALPAKGKEYPGLGYKRLRDKPPKAQQQQQPAVAQTSICCTWSSATTSTPPWGRWLDRDTVKSCFNFQRIGKSMQRPLELCKWDDLESLPVSYELESLPP